MVNGVPADTNHVVVPAGADIVVPTIVIPPPGDNVACLPSNAPCKFVISVIAWVCDVGALPSNAPCNPVISVIAWVCDVGALPSNAPCNPEILPIDNVGIFASAKLNVISGDTVALPVVIANPEPTVILFVKLKYGILIAVVPSKPTPAIFRNVSNLVADGAKLIVILGDVVALPAVIANPVPTVILFVRLK